ncbi:hypothetical protein LOD99_6235 [Oopsacas minuta]|uniref:Uncharacterized protein n=1 Tax=Oopsacas minuta TaxID=111878 RepID=A0AAV7JNJ9_9METZ|nr:hypothetical protein LOD99_6235 [Oopsacas minuta]
MKESKENVRFLMDTYINPGTTIIEQAGSALPQDHVTVKVSRSMIDGKMSGILSEAAGAKCQLATTLFIELHAIDLVRSGYPINRTITAPKDIFSSVDTTEHLALPSQQRFGMAQETLYDIDIIPAPPLHSYMCVFHFFIHMVYNLHT